MIKNDRDAIQNITCQTDEMSNGPMEIFMSAFEKTKECRRLLD